MDNLDIRIEYLYNSGFVVESENHYLIIDYYQGDLNVPKDKNVTFIVTHHHEDHYNEIIWDFKDRANYVISFDIDDIQESENIKIMQVDEKARFNDLEILALSSTDEGLSYYIRVDDIDIFHSGDLNWWAWEDAGPQREKEREAEYKNEIDKLKGKNIDIALVPVDPRLEANHHLAGEYFISTLAPKYFLPMHFRDDYSYMDSFIDRMKDNETKILKIESKNQEFYL